MKPTAADVDATRRERAAQGLPPHITDPAVLHRVAALILGQAKGPRSTCGGLSISPTRHESPPKGTRPDVTATQ